MLDDIFKISRHFLSVLNKPHKRYFLEKHPLQNRFSIIIGPRGVGKTTIIIQHILSEYQDVTTQKAIYVPVDHISIAQKSLFSIAEDFFNLGGQLICFDEIHKYQNWSGELKSIYDTFPKLKIIASGSSALEIKKGSHDLSRRAIVYKLAGLSLREFIELHTGISIQPVHLSDVIRAHEKIALDIIKLVEDQNYKILSLFKKYLQTGYFPYFIEFNDVSLYFITLEQSIHTTIESDLVAIYPSLTGRSVEKMKRLLSFIAESVPFIPDMKRLKGIIDVGDERTLKKYLMYLEDSGIIQVLTRSGQGLSRLEKPEKIYLGNPNQAYAISHACQENIGNIRETFFMNMLSLNHHISFAKKGDFVIDDQYLFEVGGKNKTRDQIKDHSNAYLALDNIELGFEKRIPLWLFGFLY